MTETNDHPLLWERWKRSLRMIGVTDAATSRAVFHALIERYSESHRHYHVPHHLQECFAVLDSTPFRDLSPEDAGAVELALWFHDIVYKPGPGNRNEQKSADILITSAKKLGIDERTRDAAAEGVLATDHQKAPTLRNECIIVDVDLAILGAEKFRFMQYEQQVRLEHMIVSGVPVDDALFWSVRTRVLQAFLDRPRIFTTDEANKRFEDKARENIARSLAHHSSPPQEKS